MVFISPALIIRPAISGGSPREVKVDWCATRSTKHIIFGETPYLFLLEPGNNQKKQRGFREKFFCIYLR